MDDEAIMMSSTPPRACDLYQVSVTAGQSTDRGCGTVRCQRPESTGPAAGQEISLPSRWSRCEPVHRAIRADHMPSIEGAMDLTVGQPNHASVLQLEHSVILGRELRKTMHTDIQLIG